MAVPSPRLSWYRSFYWRIGITFVAFVLVFLMAQGIILRRTPRAAPFDVFRGPVLAAEVAAEVGDMLVRGQHDELSAYLEARYPLPDTDQVGWMVFVATRDKMFMSTGGPLPGVWGPLAPFPSRFCGRGPSREPRHTGSATA